MKTVPDKSQIVRLNRVGKKVKKKSDYSGVYTVHCTVQSQIGKVRSEKSDEKSQINSTIIYSKIFFFAIK